MAHNGRVNSYSSLKWKHNWYDTDTFEIVVNRYKNGVDLLVNSGFIGYASPLGGYNIGCVDRVEKPLGPAGKSSEMWTITGRGIESILSNRLCISQWAVGDGYDTQTGAAETNMRHYVDIECITVSNADREIAGLTLEAADAGAGGAIEYKARGQPLTEVLYDHCKQTGLSFELAWSGTGKNFEYRTLEGTDLSSGADMVVFSVDFGNVNAYDYVYSVLDQRNLVYVGGEGDANLRTLASISDGAAPTGWSRREVFVDAKECTEVAELAAKGNQVLEERAATETLDFVFNHLSPSFVLGTDFTLGDTVIVEFPGVATMTSRITSITERYGTDGKSFEMAVGKSAPDLVSIIRAQNKRITSLGTR
jgi:hypothetical protein